MAACSDSGSTGPGNTTPPPDSGSTPAVRITELHYDNVGTDTGEAVEIEGPAGTDLTGWSVVLYNGNGGASYDTHALTGTIPAMCNARGVVRIDYPVNGIQNGSPDGLALVSPNGVVEFFSYEGTFAATNGPANGKTSTDIGVSENPDNSVAIGQSLQRRPDNGAWFGPAAATFGACNTTPSSSGSSISFSGRSTGDPPLPVGFEAQLFATLHNGTGATVSTTFTWTSQTPAIASVDARGVIHALAEGSATFRATAGDGTSATLTLPTVVAAASTTAQYGNNTEFGTPRDADTTDDFIVRRVEYTASVSRVRGTPNWVSYDLDASQIGSNVDRCDCFTYDPALPATFTHFTTADYTGAGAAAGYNIDRGHLARSADRTAGALDNATTYYFTNIIPQASDLNQGPWAALEDYLSDQARTQNMEVFVIAGVAGSKGTVKNEGKITIPSSVWKVAIILPRDHGLADVRTAQDLTVIAVNMPNDPGVRSVNWQTYKTTVDAIEALSGYDLLDLLPDDIETVVESRVGQPPPGLRRITLKARAEIRR